MSSSTRPSRTEIAEGFGALFVIAAGLLGIPLLLATIVGWPLPHHLPMTGQLHSAAGSQIPDAFWPKALAVIAWLAWGYFVFSLLIATIDVIRNRRRGTWRPVSYTHLRAHETGRNLVCRLLLEKKKK